MLRGREDALKFLAKCYIEHTPGMWRSRIYEKVNEFLYRAQDWKCNGAVVHLDVGCRNHAIGALEAKQVLEEAGIPVFTYEAANTDPRYLGPSRVTEQMETFLESRLGLRRLPPEELNVA